MDIWGFLLLIVIIGLWMGAKLTTIGLMALGGIILLVTVLWAWRGYFTKGLSSVPAVLAVLGLWMGWGAGLIAATPEYWEPWSPHLRPIVDTFIK